MALFGEIASLFRIGIDDERAVESLMNVPLQRAGVAVVEMEPERLGGEFVGVLIADGDLAPPDACDAVMKRAMNAVEVHRVWMRAGVREVNAQQIALVGAQGRPRHPAVVGPGGKEKPGCNLDLAVEGDDVPLPHNC